MVKIKAQDDISPICPKPWCCMDGKQQSAMVTGDRSNLLLQNKETTLRATLSFNAQLSCHIHVLPNSIWTATKTGRKRREHFLLHPSANQKNNHKLFKVYQWMQTTTHKASSTHLSADYNQGS
ncbi:hypothetical protein I79_006530 [Cricetulus griseus]|uniref:Uncharacterized protein n=1 Tax=Cricetulus griseus TaxID=10029 RepID=G3H833_CRIGR|nr:hypothetical protein I79_006530 [Cricetulus griseus]